MKINNYRIEHLAATQIFPVLFLVFIFSPVKNLQAMEGAGSHYTQGTRGDFAPALMGPPGWYVRNEITFIDGSSGALTRGNQLYTRSDQEIWLNTVKLVYLAESGILGGRFGLGVSVPIVLDATVSGVAATPLHTEREGSRTGISDLNVTGLVNWKNGNFNYSFGLGIYIPNGSYDADDFINLGRNYWSLDPTFSFTWLHPERGHELSFTAGYMVNTENPDTDYQSGNEFHLDVNLAQHFSSSFALALDLYYYRQITSDDGPFLDQANATLPALGLPPLGDFRGECFGLGPAVKYTTKIGQRDVNFILKWLHDIDSKNRFDSDTLMLSIAFPF